MGVLKSIAKYEASKATSGLSEMVPGMQSNVMKAKNIGDGVKAIKQNTQFKERNTKTASYIEDYKKGLASAGALASVALGVAGARKLHSKMETESVWRRLQKEHPELTSGASARENFEVLQKFSPDLASNISTARSYMQRMAHTNMTPHEFVKDLTNIQKTRNSSGVGSAIESAASRADFRFKG